MRRIGTIITVILLCCSSAAYAVPARKGCVRVVSLADGTTVEVSLCGDENAHWWMDAAGVCYSLSADGVATALAADAATLSAAGAARKSSSDARRCSRLSAASSSRAAAYSGTKKGLVILVNFLNQSMSSATALDDFTRMFTEEGYSDNGHIGSVSDYFLDQSYGQFGIDFDVVGPVTVSENYQYYGQNSGGNDKYPCTMVIEACRLVDDAVDFSLYDWDGDGEVDQVFLIYAGYGENYGAGSDTIWPHEWTLSSGRSYGDGEGAITLDGVRINTYAVTCELAGTTGATYAGMGTACHEFSHCLGYPDFYDTSYTGGWGMEGWDLLDQGSYGGPSYNGEVPAGYTSYERLAAGWLSPTVLSAGDTLSLSPLNDGPSAAVLYNAAHSDEYYLLENRRGDRWFSYVENFSAPSGLLILHVDYDSRSWANNTPNNNASHQRMTIFQANDAKGTYRNSYYYLSQDEYAGHVYPYNANDSLTALSTPSATLYNASSSGTYYMPDGIYDITCHADDTVSFRIGGEASSSEEDEDDADDDDDSGTAGSVLFYESFDQCTGKGGNDGTWKGITTTSALIPDNDGWDFGEKSYGGYQCARLGNSTFSSHATTPYIYVDGTAVLTFKAGAWDATKEETTYDLYACYNSESNIVFIGAAVEMEKGAWTTYTYTLTGRGDWISLTFNGGGRFFLDEVLLYIPADDDEGTTDDDEGATDDDEGTTDDDEGVTDDDDEGTTDDEEGTTDDDDEGNTDTGISAASSSAGTPYIYSLSGVRLGTSLSSLPPGIYICNGKKVLR